MPDSASFNVDKVLTALGSLGKYQILLVLLACLGEPPACYQLLGNVFIGMEVPHQCAPIENVTSHVEDFDQLYNASLEYRQCDVIVQANGTVYQKLSCLSGNRYELPRDHSVISQFDLVCEKSSLFSLTQTLVFAGQGVGSLIGPIISDRYGRKVAIVSANVGLLVVGISIAFSPGYIVFAVFKFLAGVFQQALYVSKAVYLVELFPTSRRRLSALLCGLSWTSAGVTMAFFSYLMRDWTWRMLQLTMSLSSVLLVLQIWALDESIRWLVANNKMKEARACVKRASRWNSKHFETVLQAAYPDNKRAETGDVPNQGLTSAADRDAGNDVTGGVRTKKLTMLDVFRVNILIINAAIMWFAWFTCALGYFTLYLTGSTLSGNKYLNYALLSFMNCPSVVINFFGFERVGRKPTTILQYSVLGSGLFAIGIFSYLSEREGDVFDSLTLVATLYAMIGGSGSFFSVFFYLPEFVPTNVRNQATGVASFMARIGAMLAPFIGSLMAVAVWLPGLLIGVCATVVAFSCTALPETRNKELPQTLEELQAWYDQRPRHEESETVGKGHGDEKEHDVLL